MNIWAVIKRLREEDPLAIRIHAYKDDNSLFTLRTKVKKRDPREDEIYLWRWMNHVDHYMQVLLPGRRHHWADKRWLRL